MILSNFFFVLRFVKNWLFIIFLHSLFFIYIKIYKNLKKNKELIELIKKWKKY